MTCDSRPAARAVVLLGALALLIGLALVPFGPAEPGVAVGTSAGKTVGWLHTDGATIRTAKGKAYQIKAISWFGMETPNCAPHGLWQIGLDDGLARIKADGFNTIRLPYSNECLHAAATTSIDATKNPQLVGKSPLQVMDFVIKRANAYGLSVFLDRHRPDSGSQSELWYTPQWSEKRWIADWVMLAKRYRNNPGVIGADLHNEPHGTACWGCGDRSRDWAKAAVRAGNKVLAANPKWLIIVEGVERQGNGSTTWWGGGLADAKKHPVKLAVAHRLVYSPHDYPASIYPQKWFGSSNYPANLAGVWTRNWGYLDKSGTAPVLLGEFGTKLQTDSDRQWLKAMVRYLKTNKMSFAYWSFNPNSGDTGGIVKDDWTTSERAKLKALSPLIKGTALPATPKPTPSDPSPSPSPSPTPGPSSPAGGTARWTLQSSWDAGYVAQIALTPKQQKNGWTLSWTDRNARSVVNNWGMTCQVKGDTVSCRGADWAATLAKGQTTTVGLQVATSGKAPTNPRLTFR